MPRIIVALASPKTAATFFVITAIAAYWARLPERSATLAMTLPFALLTASLLAAIVSNRRFRADLPLLLFHLALLALAMIFALGRLTYFEGQAAVTSGTTFDGTLLNEESGPLHARRIESVRFVNLGFTEDFPERGRFRATYNRVRWQTSGGALQTADIGDDIPLVIDGYRIYTSRQRGFSPVFRWIPHDGPEDWGAVQLNDSNNGAFAGANDWTLPDGAPAWIMIASEADAQESGPRVRTNLGAYADANKIILRIDDQRHEMLPGDELVRPGGRLTYVRLESWMGYRIVSDPTKPWLLGSVGLAVLSLVWFYARILLRPIPKT